MTFTGKDWRNATTHEGGGDTSTPISAVAIEDLETRVTDYGDDHAAAFSVIDYGADPTGASDSTTDFETTCTTAGAGAHIYVPEGTYIVDRVNLTIDHQTWELAPGAIVKLKNSSTFHRTFEIEGDYVTIIGGEFDGNRANNSGGVAGVIDINGANHCRIQNVYVHDGENIGIRAYAAAAGTTFQDVEISSSVFIDCCSYGVFFNNTTLSTTPGNGGYRILSCWSDNSAVAAASVVGAGFAINGGTDTDLVNFATGCTIANCYVKSRVDATTECSGIGMWAINGAQVTGCYTENISFEGYALVACKSLSITACTDRGSATYGFELAGSADADIGTISAAMSGCHIDGKAVTETGIVLDQGNDIAVTGCVIRNLVDSTNATGIMLANPDAVAATGRYNITGNTIYTTYRGIADTDEYARDVVIASNTIICNGTQASQRGIWVDWTGLATGTSLRRRYVNNHITDFFYGVWFYNNNAVATYKDVICRYNTTFGANTPITKDGNITFDATCSIDDEALLGWAV